MYSYFLNSCFYFNHLNVYLATEVITDFQLETDMNLRSFSEEQKFETSNNFIKTHGHPKK